MAKKLIHLIVSDVILPFIVATILSLVLFWPTVIKQQLPIATDILTGYHKPWIYKQFPNSPFPFPVKNMESFDVVRFFYPTRYLAMQQYKKGQWPLWNSSQLSGTPLGAEFTTGAFYPLNVIFAVMPFAWGFGILAILQIFLAVVTFYYFIRALALSKFSAVFGGVTFALSGVMAGFFHSLVFDHAFLWLPVALLSIAKLAKTRGSIWIATLALAIVGMALASHLQVLFYAALLLVAYAFFYYLQTRKRFIIIFSILGILLGALGSMIQLLPSIELLTKSVRSENIQDVIGSTFGHFFHLVLFVAPNYFGNPGRQNYFGGPSYYHEYSIYIGIPVLLFAIYALVITKKSKEVYFWVLTATVSILFAVENPLSRLPFLLNIPVLSSITATRSFAFADLAIIILAAFGFDSILQNNQLLKRKALVIFIFVLFCAFCIMLINIKFPGIFFQKYLMDVPKNRVISLHNLVLPTFIFILTCILTAGFYFFKKIQVVYCLLLILFLINTADLIHQFNMQNGFVPIQSIFPQIASTKLLSSQSLPPRVIGTEDRIMTPDFGAYYGYENVDGYSAGLLKNYAATFANYNGDKRHYVKMMSITNIFSPVIRLLGVDYVFSSYTADELVASGQFKEIARDNDVITYENYKSIPRFYLTNENIDDHSDLELVKNRSITFSDQEGSQTNPSSITVVDYQPNVIILKVNNSKWPQILQTMLPNYPGWKAYINGREKPITISKDSFIGVLIPSGRSTVKFSYQPMSFTLGLYSSIIGCLVILGIGIHYTFKQWLKFKR